MCNTNPIILISCIVLGYFLGDIAIPDADTNHSKQTKEEVALQEELERYKKEVLEGLQIEEEGLTDLVRKKTKQAANADAARSYNDPVDGTGAYPLNNIKNQVLKNSLNSLKTDPSDHGIQKRSDSMQPNATDSSEILRTRHRKRHVIEHPGRKKRYVMTFCALFFLVKNCFNLD